ncbi:hypothetical protein Q8G35_18075 [Peribacillus simplex]|uniref:Uncharacterized protein n=2 Tax=Peribacillus TaxID=2675229 RepID=A0AA90PN37_9BACI|nr:MULTISPECIES: hypothetical protein [Peribacillus]MDP1420242.1 hypothetical protein [Peribacillus simplex]MDP1453620.1 hypothetical protein [Peribacillus frigoritolerans]
MAITAFPDNLTARIHEADIAGIAVKALTEGSNHRQTSDLTDASVL